MFRNAVVLLFALVLVSCEAPQSGGVTGAPVAVSAQVVGELPVTHANNAVALSPDGSTIYSFNGLRAGKTWTDVSKDAFKCDLPSGMCEQIPPLPVEEGRLATVAVTLGARIYIFGGYTVAEDGAEVSTPEVVAFDPETQTYSRRTDMPTPVDDAVAFTHAGRYIYLVSGWHDDGNVSLTQVYDADEDRWFRATDYPGAPVFGHAGAAANGAVIIADGVAVVGEENGRRKFGAVDEAWRGDIDPADPAVISWRRVSAHPGGPLYRMAAGSDKNTGRIYFYGGGDNPYNFDGIGYDGVAAKASDLLFVYDLGSDEWRVLGATGRPSMDHRGLIVAGGAFWTLGGMNNDGAVIGDLVRIMITQ